MPRFLSVSLVAALALSAAETKVRLQDASPAVQKTVAAESKGATGVRLTKETENGRIVYELETKADDRTRDLPVEQELTLHQIPAPARAAIEKHAAGDKITKVETITAQGSVAYEAALLIKRKQSEVKVAADGSPVR